MDTLEKGVGDYLDHMRGQLETAAGARCGGDPKRSCWPSPDAGCAMSGSRFCSLRLRRSILASDISSMAEREMSETRLAEVIGIPRRHRRLLDIGCRGFSDGLVESSAILRLDELKNRVLVVLSGETGCGKSLAAARWAWQRRAYWFAAIRAHWWQPYIPDSWRFASCDNLVIDGLQKAWTGGSSVVGRNLRYLVDERYDQLRPTLITTDLGRTEFEAIVGRRYVDAEHQDVTWIQIQQGPSLRTKEGRERARQMGEGVAYDHPRDWQQEE